MSRGGWLIVNVLVFALLVVGVTLGARYYLHERYDAGTAPATPRRSRSARGPATRPRSAGSRITPRRLPSTRPATQPLRRRSMMKFSLFVSALLLSACTSALRYVVTDLPPPPKRKAPLAAMAPIQPAGWFDQTLNEILSR